MAEIINGKLVSQALRENIKADVDDFFKTTGKHPGLAVILVGEDPASRVYVKNKHKACLDVGMSSFQFECPDDVQERVVLDKISELNSDSSVNGILVQLPLPDHINEEKVIRAIDPMKDVDAFHPENVGKILIGTYNLLPCTPAGIVELLKFYNVDVCGKKCAVIGRSNIVGKPMALLLTELNGTVTLCHSKTADLSSITQDSDIVVVAVGKPAFLKANMIKSGAVVIDVGINRLPDGKLVGDVDYIDVEPKAGMITPVPGGVGPMTITVLLKNTLSAARQQILE